MKIFIVFLGLLLINVSIISFKGDYESYIYLHRMLDSIAFEAAEAAAAGTGDAEEFAGELMDYSIKNLVNVDVRDHSCEIFFDADFAVALARMEVEGLFGFPFSAGTSIISEKRCRIIE